MGLLTKKKKTYNLLQFCIAEIHDALLFKVRLDQLPAAYAQAKQLMEQDVVKEVKRVYNLTLRVPLMAEAKAGFRYGALIEYDGERVLPFLKKLKTYNSEVEHKILETYKEKAA
jgi:hypothetical protein